LPAADANVKATDVPHQDCPTKHQIDSHNDHFATPRKNKHQHGHNQHDKYHVLAVAHARSLTAICWTDKLHPHTQAPDFRTDEPRALIDASNAPNSPIWAQLRNRPQLKILVAAALERMDLCKWPS